MNRNLIIGLAIGLVIGFGGGFVFTNSINRRETEQLRAEASRAKEVGANSANATARRVAENPTQLGEDEVRAAVARADAEPRDIYLQRNLGQYLYLYAAQSGNNSYLPDAIRLLERAERNDQENFDTLVLLGNAHFDLARTTDARRFIQARSYYERALRLRPDDSRVRTDLGLTHFYANPSDPRAAIKEYERALVVNPRGEATLQHLAAALIAVGDFDSARRRLEELRQINPNNPAAADLHAQLAGRLNETGAK